MALNQTEQLILLTVLGVLLTFITYFELKVVRRKSADARAASMKKDEAFNAVLTTRTVLNTVRNRGGNVGGAPALLDRAKDAMSRGFYDSCIELCEKARSELKKPSSSPDQPENVPDSEAKERLEAIAESIVSTRPVRTLRTESDSYTGTKLDGPGEGNYLGAKFEMSAAKADIGRASVSGMDSAVADGFMVEAEAAFAAGNYDKALSLAVRARRSLSASSGGDAILLGKVEEQEMPTPEPEEDGVRDEAAKAPSERVCGDCGAVLDNDDMFCPICGAKVPVRACLSCGAQPRPDDKFCRKCGFKIG